MENGDVGQPDDDDTVQIAETDEFGSTAGGGQMIEADDGQMAQAAGGQMVQSVGKEVVQPAQKQGTMSNQELLEDLSEICDRLNDSNADKLAEEFMNSIQSPDFRRSIREKKAPGWHSDFVSFLSSVKFNEPVSFQKALNGSDACRWKEAIKEELEAHETNKTWDLVPRSSGKSVIVSKWVFKIQNFKNGKPNRYKARFSPRIWCGLQRDVFTCC